MTRFLSPTLGAIYLLYVALVLVVARVEFAAELFARAMCSRVRSEAKVFSRRAVRE